MFGVNEWALRQAMKLAKKHKKVELHTELSRSVPLSAEPAAPQRNRERFPERASEQEADRLAHKALIERQKAGRAKALSERKDKEKNPHDEEPA